MTQKRRSLRAGKAKATLDQPLEIFEKALALLDEVGRPSSDTARLPALPLPSLLERCESVLEQKGSAAHSLLICADGLEALRPDWWQAHAGGIGVQILPVSEDPDAVALQLEAFAHSEERQGRHALTLASLDMAPRLLRLFDTVRLLSWHPWSSFAVAPRAVTLEEHCRLTGTLIDRFEGVPTVKIEGFGPFPARQAAGIAAAFGLTLPARATSSRLMLDRMPPPVDLEGGPRYRQLCERLDYAPSTVPLPPALPGTLRRPLTLDALVRRADQDDGDRTGSRSGPRARISWLRPRLDRLGLPAPITDEAGLEELVSLLDRCLAHTDFREELDPLVETLHPGMASLLLLLASAHWTRISERGIALELAGKAMDLAARTMLELRQLGASLYADLGYPQYALRLASGPLLDNGILDAPSYGIRDRHGRVGSGTRPPVIVIAGMRHSGSTALFNTVRLGYLAVGLDPLAGYSETDGFVEKARDAQGPVVLKTHEFRDDICALATTIITTVRDLRDSVASAVRRNFPLAKRIGSQVEYAKYNRMLHDVWLPHSDFLFEYERYMRNPLAVTCEIFELIGIDVRVASDVVPQVATLPVDDYRTTLLSPSHVTDPERKLEYVDTLASDTIDRITSDHGLWLASNGYSLAPKTCPPNN